MADKTRRRALRVRGRKARPSLSRPGIGAAYCVDSRRPACVNRRTRVAAYAYHLMRLVASGSNASVASWPLAPVSLRCHKPADAPAAGIPSVSFRHHSQTGASGHNLPLVHLAQVIPKRPLGLPCHWRPISCACARSDEAATRCLSQDPKFKPNIAPKIGASPCYFRPPLAAGLFGACFQSRV